MFLNLSPPDGGTVFDMCPPGSMMVDGVCVGDPSTYGPRILIDQDVNYYGFLKSTEYNNWMKSIEGQVLTMDIYDSPYFGFQGSGVYADLDKVYEAYRERFVGLDDIKQPVDETGRYEAHMRQLKAEADAKILAQQNTGISPLLILAAAAAFFIGS